MITLHIVSTHRADLGHLEPLLHAANADNRFQTRMSREGDTMRYFHRDDITIFQGDRTELLEYAALAIRGDAIIAHAAGGEVTKGSTDNSVRDAISKLSHFHYPVHQGAKQNLMRLGEEDWRICVVGEIGHDAGLTEGACPVDAKPGDLVVAYHPVTARYSETNVGLGIISAMVAGGNYRHVWLTEPNGDYDSYTITNCWDQLCEQHDNCTRLHSLGHDGFRSLVRTAGTIMGNSSAILTEAPMLGAYPILIGTRQEGRRHSEFKPGACKRILDHLATHIGRPDVRVK